MTFQCALLLIAKFEDLRIQLLLLGLQGEDLAALLTQDLIERFNLISRGYSRVVQVLNELDLESLSLLVQAELECFQVFLLYMKINGI